MDGPLSSRGAGLEIHPPFFPQDRSGKSLSHHAEVIACARAETGQVLFQVAALALSWRWPHSVGLGYALPLMVASALSAYRLLAEHTPVRKPSRTALGSFASTADHGLGWLGRLLLAPHNVGCHIVHHLHRQVAASHLLRRSLQRAQTPRRHTYADRPLLRGLRSWAASTSRPSQRRARVVRVRFTSEPSTRWSRRVVMPQRWAASS